MEKQQVVEALGQMTVFELIALTKELEDKWGVKAAPAPVEEQKASTTRGNAPWGTYPGEEVDLTVVLCEAGPSKINVIKAVRELFGLGLKEAKDLVDNAPRHLKEGLAKADAEELKSKLEAAGAKIELVPS